MPSPLKKDFFELFGFPVSYQIDVESLASRYRDLQGVVHPDRFASAPEQERRLALQIASHVNEGFKVLGNPMSRARYLLQLHGKEVGEGPVDMPQQFLQEQMALHESLEEIAQQPDSAAGLREFCAQLDEREQALERLIAGLFDDGGDAALDQALFVYYEMRFLARLRQQAGGEKSTSFCLDG